MSPRDDLDGQATTARARRRPDDRGRRAGRLVARAEWLSDAMVFWTGRREDAPRLGDTAAPLRAALQIGSATFPKASTPFASAFPRSGLSRSSSPRSRP